MKNISVGVASGLDLDWLVAQAEKVSVTLVDNALVFVDEHGNQQKYSPSTDPAQAYAIIGREKIQTRWIDKTESTGDDEWLAQDCAFRTNSSSVDWSRWGRSYPDLCLGYMTGPTLLIAAMRFHVAKKSVEGQTFLRGKKAQPPMVKVPKKH